MFAASFGARRVGGTREEKFDDTARGVGIVLPEYKMAKCKRSLWGAGVKLNNLPSRAIQADLAYGKIIPLLRSTGSIPRKSSPG